MTEVEKAYIAGFFDGEGTVSLYYIERTNQFICKACISNTYKSILDTLQECYGGRVSFREKGTNKPVYAYQVCNVKAKDFLSDIYPYLNEKKPQAKLLIDLVTWRKAQHKRSVDYADWIWMDEECKRLKRIKS